MRSIPQVFLPSGLSADGPAEEENAPGPLQSRARVPVRLP